MRKMAISELLATTPTTPWDSVAPISCRSRIFPRFQSIYSLQSLGYFSLGMRRSGIIGNSGSKSFVTIVFSDIYFL